jgi:hypothetical protein
VTLSIRQQVAEGVKCLLETWPDSTGDVVIERTYGIESFADGWTGGSVRVCAYVVSVEGERIARNQDQQEITVAVAYLRKIPADSSVDETDAADAEAESLWIWIRDNAQRLTLESGTASRVNTTVPTPYSAEWLRNNAIYCQVITSVYRVLSTR